MASSFLFLDGIEPFFAHQFSMTKTTKLFSSIFDLGPNAQNLLPKNCTKSPISRLVWQIDRRCLGLDGVFGDGRFNGTMQNVVGRPLLPCQRNLGGNLGFFYKIAYKSPCMAHRPETFGPTRGPTRGPNPCCHGNDIWPRRGYLVAYRLVLNNSQWIQVDARTMELLSKQREEMSEV